MPDRIRRERREGWRKPDGAVIVDRTSIWGNPRRWSIYLSTGAARTPANAKRMAADWYDDWLDGHYRIADLETRRLRILTRLGELAGKDLACPCNLPEPGQADHCHAARLITRVQRWEVAHAASADPAPAGAAGR